jgi:hypothetical protein
LRSLAESILSMGHSFGARVAPKARSLSRPDETPSAGDHAAPMFDAHQFPRVRAAYDDPAASAYRVARPTALGTDTMKRPSPALTMLFFFWAVYGLVAATVLYRALAPLQRDLLLLLGGIGAVLVVVSFVLLSRAPAGASADEQIR